MAPEPDQSHQRSNENRGGKKLNIILTGAVALVVVLAVGVMWAGADTTKRPGADPGSTQHAPAD